MRLVLSFFCIAGCALSTLKPSAVYGQERVLPSQKKLAPTPSKKEPAPPPLKNDPTLLDAWLFAGYSLHSLSSHSLSGPHVGAQVLVTLLRPTDRFGILAGGDVLYETTNRTISQVGFSVKEQLDTAQVGGQLGVKYGFTPRFDIFGMGSFHYAFYNKYQFNITGSGSTEGTVDSNYNFGVQAHGIYQLGKNLGLGGGLFLGSGQLSYTGGGIKVSDNYTLVRLQAVLSYGL